jgi:hypothetical protein
VFDDESGSATTVRFDGLDKSEADVDENDDVFDENRTGNSATSHATTAFTRPARRTKRSSKTKTKVKVTTETETGSEADLLNAKNAKDDMEREAKQAEIRLQVEQERRKNDAHARLQEKLRLKRGGFKSYKDYADEFVASSEDDETAFNNIRDVNVSFSEIDLTSDSDSDQVEDRFKGKETHHSKAARKFVDSSSSDSDDDNDHVKLRMTLMKKRKKKNPNSKSRRTMKSHKTIKNRKKDVIEDDNEVADEVRGVENTDVVPTTTTIITASSITTIDEDTEVTSVSTSVPPRPTKMGSKPKIGVNRKKSKKTSKASSKRKSREDAKPDQVQVNVRRPSRASLGVLHDLMTHGHVDEDEDEDEMEEGDTRIPM